MEELQDELPTIDIDFLDELIRNSDYFEDFFEVGRTKAYLLKGNKPVSLRTIYIRNTGDGLVDFEKGSGIAIRLKKMSSFLDWLRTNRSWKSGAYVEAD